MSDFRKHIEVADAELAERGIPIILRPSRILRQLSRASVCAESHESVRAIAQWYEDTYGPGASWDCTIGRQPVLLRGIVYVVIMPFVTGRVLARVTDHIPNLPSNVAESLSDAETKYPLQTSSAAFEDFLILYNLTATPDLLSDGQWELVWRALLDLKNAATMLHENQDTHACAFSSQQAAEKFLKAALLGYGFDATFLKKQIGHDIEQCLTRLLAKHRKYNHIKHSVRILRRVDMDVRYSDSRHSFADAVGVFNAARWLCAFLAQQWMLDKMRGAPEAALCPGRFYEDLSGRNYRCISVIPRRGQPASVDMMVINIPSPLGPVSAAMRMSEENACFYAPLTNAEQVNTLEARYRELIASA